MSASPNTRLLLLRHAEVEAAYQRIFGGRIDMNLSPRGAEQAAALGRYLRRREIHAVYASPMRRVQQTLAHYAGNGSPEATVLPGLREVDFGDWTGHGWDAIRERFGVSAYDWLELLEAGKISNAESPAGYRARIAGCVEQICAAHPGRTIAVFCHGGVVRMMLSVLLKLPLGTFAHFDVDYASLTEVELHAQRRPEVQLLNFTPWRDLAP